MLVVRNICAFNITKITQLNELITDNNIISAEFIHFIDNNTNLDNVKVEKLLSYSLPLNIISNNQLIIIPRLGTISAWSSKATDIFNLCGLNIKRIERGIVYHFKKPIKNKQKILAILIDKMVEQELKSIAYKNNIFKKFIPQKLNYINIITNKKTAIKDANIKLGLALNSNEIDYLFSNFIKIGRNPTDIELMMFAQANSEHCRHKIFNANWLIDNNKQDHTLFSMIKNTYKQNPDDLLSVYSDNAAVATGFKANYFMPNKDGVYVNNKEHKAIVIKVETHNHPTAIEPYAGAATGSGGEIRDEGATGRGSKPKAALCGFSVSNLRIPQNIMPWEQNSNQNINIASSLEIMLKAPIGSANYNNEFGRANICGYFRTFEQKFNNILYGYHKPIMLAGGIGTIRKQHVTKSKIKNDDIIIVFGGPGMLIGLGGGASSSNYEGNQELDFASVQRANPEMQRRAQEVIDRCVSLGNNNPIISIHDIGAGGLSNGLPELVNDSSLGATFEIRKIPTADKQMSPLEIWCNESQERYVVAITSKKLPIFEEICQRERVPFAVIGTATNDKKLIVSDSFFNNKPIDIPMNLLLGNTPKIIRKINILTDKVTDFNAGNLDFDKSLNLILQLPSVASKRFLITIGDRSVSGLIARDQMIGAKQVPVADCGIVLSDYDNYYGEIMAIGERAPLSLINAKASAKMAIGEALTNILGGYTANIKDINLSANWMCAANIDNESAKLFAAVKEVGLNLCPDLGITIPVGKDSMSMQNKWVVYNKEKKVVSPLSLVVSAFAKTIDVRKQITPLLKNKKSELLLIDLGAGKNRLALSSLAQVYNIITGETPDLDDSKLFKIFFTTINKLNNLGLISAYHDRSDGGAAITLLEMSFASEVGLNINSCNIAKLFNEELGCVIQVLAKHKAKVNEILTAAGLNKFSEVIATINDTNIINFAGIKYNKNKLHKLWEKTSYNIAKLRDNPSCVDEEYKNIGKDNGLVIDIKFNINENIAAPYINKAKPRVAILREQGVNGQIEMAAAFNKANFSAIDVHMSDILTGKITLNDFNGLVACGGFSYGDVLGAGSGWAHSILYNNRAYDEFANFFTNNNTFALGVCNGCQMISQLNIIIPNANFPKFNKNISNQFESRFSSVKIQKNNSIFLTNMQDSIMPIAIAHSEGNIDSVANNIIMQYVDNNAEITQTYPHNPNGSINAVAGLCSDDGKVTIMMPHPERVIRAVCNSYYPDSWVERSPWMKIFDNARKYIG